MQNKYLRVRLYLQAQEEVVSLKREMECMRSDQQMQLAQRMEELRDEKDRLEDKMDDVIMSARDQMEEAAPESPGGLAREREARRHRYRHIFIDFIFVLECPYRLNMLYWNIPTDGIFCTGISLPTEHFVLEYPS